MALVNHSKREINAKIVYYGREGAGKRASLQYVYDRVKPALRGELKCLPTGDDSLFFFDFSPFENPVFDGYRVRFHMYSLPGKVANLAAWKMILKGVDGLVIVADSAVDQLSATRESILYLRGILGAYGLTLQDIPCVLQLNRTSGNLMTSAAVSAADLDAAEMYSCFSDTTSGEGVLEALTNLSRKIIARISQNDTLHTPPAGAQAVTECGTSVPGTKPSPEHDEMLVSAGALSTGPEQPDMCAVQPDEGSEDLQVAVAREGVASTNGMVRIPLDLTLGGTCRRLVVTIAADSLQKAGTVPSR